MTERKCNGKDREVIIYCFSIFVFITYTYNIDYFVKNNKNY